MGKQDIIQRVNRYLGPHQTAEMTIEIVEKFAHADGGGTLVAEGTPEQVALVQASHTGRYLGKVLRGESLIAGK